MRRRIKFLAIFVMILLMNITNVVAATDLKITDVKPVSYTTKKNPFGKIVGNRDFQTSIENTNKSLILTSTSKFVETEIDDDDYDYDLDKTGYYKHNYKVYYTNDSENYNTFDLTNFVKEKYECDNSEKCRINFRTVFNKDNTFYMSGYIEKIEAFKDEYDNDEYKYTYIPILIKTNDGKTYEKVNNLPTYNYDGIGIYSYNNTYMLVGEKYISEDEKYEYYTSTDLNNWVKHELKLTDFGYTDEEIKYLRELIKYEGISSWGVHFTSGYEEYRAYDFPDYANAKTIVTKDFNKYTLIDESEVTTANSKIYCDDSNPDFCNGGDYTDNWNVYKTSGLFTSENQTVGLKLANKILDGPIGGLYTKGWDMYIMRPNTNKFVPLIGKKDDSYVRWYYTWADEGNKIFVFTTLDNKSTIYYFDDYEKSLDYTEYNLEIDSEKINSYVMDGEKNQFILLYGEEYLLITDAKFSKVTRMRIPKTKEIAWADEGKKLSLINENNIYTMDTDSIYNAEKLEKINISDCNAALASSYNYTGKYLKPDVNITYGSTKLKLNTDYKLSYKNNKNVGTATVTIKGIGKYTGTLTKTFKIVVAQPKTIKKSTQTSSSITLKWSKPSGSVTGYQVYYSTKKDTGYKKATTITKNKTLSYKKTKLSSGKIYYFKVRSYKTIGGKKYYSSYTSPIKVMTAPKAVSVKASTSTNSVKLSWKSAGKYVEYDIYRSTNKKKYTKVDTTGTNTYTDKNLSSGKTYYYKVRTKIYNYDDQINGSYSKVVSATTKPLSPTIKVSTSSTSATIKWNKISSASGYEIYQSTNGKKYSKIKTITKGSTTSYKKTKLSKAKGYYYKVRAYKKVGSKKVYSSYSKVVTGVTTPSTPGSVKVKLDSLGVKISYKKVSGVTGYEIYASTDKKNYVALGTTNKLSYIDTKGEAGVKYYYKVRSYKEVNGVKKYSGYSKVVSYTKPVTQPQ